MRVNVFWKTSQEIDGCLYANSTLLRCWTNKQQVEERLDILLQENMTFTLQYNQHVLATQEVKVNASRSAKYRRRLRSKWSLF
jgi:predicted secreted acid phosphatase